MSDDRFANIAAYSIIGVIILAIAFYPATFALGFILSKTDKITVYEVVKEDDKLEFNVTKYIPRGIYGSTIAFLATPLIDVQTVPKYITKNNQTVTLSNYNLNDRIVINSTQEKLYTKLDTYGGMVLKEGIVIEQMIAVNEITTVIGFTPDHVGCEDLLPESSYDDFLYWIGSTAYRECS